MTDAKDREDNQKPFAKRKFSAGQYTGIFLLLIFVVMSYGIITQYNKYKLCHNLSGKFFIYKLLPPEDRIEVIDAITVASCPLQMKTWAMKAAAIREKDKAILDSIFHKYILFINDPNIDADHKEKSVEYMLNLKGRYFKTHWRSKIEAIQCDPK